MDTPTIGQRVEYYHLGCQSFHHATVLSVERENKHFDSGARVLLAKHDLMDDEELPVELWFDPASDDTPIVMFD